MAQSVRGAGVYASQRNRGAWDVGWERPSPSHFFPHAAILNQSTVFSPSYFHLWSLFFHFILFLYGFTPSYSALPSSLILVCFSLQIHPPPRVSLLCFFMSLNLPSLPISCSLSLVPLMFPTDSLLLSQHICWYQTNTHVYMICVGLYAYRQAWKHFMIFFILFTTHCSKYSVHDRPAHGLQSCSIG